MHYKLSCKELIKSLSLLAISQVNKVARDIISLYHSPEDNFGVLYQNKNIAVELPTIEYNSELVDEKGMFSILDCILLTGKYKSKSEVRRLLQQGAVKINGEKTSELLFLPQNNMIISVGKGNIFKLVETVPKIARTLKR